MTSLLETKGLTKAYDETGERLEILRGVDFSMREGEIVALTGVSGAGKSTFLNLLGALDRPSSGHILFKGKNIAEYSEKEKDQYRRRHLGFIFQFHHLLPEFDALQNVQMPALILGRSAAECRDEAMHLIELVGLADRCRHLPSELSGGERQRVAVARALMNKPDLVLADEPSGNLDDRNSDRLHSLFIELNQRFGQAFLIVTHDQRLAALAMRTVHMSQGRMADL